MNNDIGPSQETTDQLDAVVRMQAYISEHLYETVSLAELSKASLYSPWYSYRLFVRWAKMTPAAYIRRLRLSKSALRLRDEKATITEVAFQVGYDSIEGYQRAFSREFGCNPHAYAKNPVPIYLFTPWPVKDAFLNRKDDTMNETTKASPAKTILIQPVERTARKCLIKRGKSADNYFDYCEEVGCDLWGLLTSIQSPYGGAVSMWLPASLIAPGTSKYVSGVEVAADYNGVIPEGLEAIDLPAATYLMFQGQPYEEAAYCDAIDEVWAAIDRYDPALAGYEWDKTNPRIQLEPIGARGYIELLPVKKKPL